MRRFILLGLVCGLLLTSHAWAVSTVTISGTHNEPDSNVSAFGNYRPFKIDTSTLFYLDQPIKVTGSVDVSSLKNNSMVCIGLISKDRYDAWVAANIPGGNNPNNNQTGFFGFIDTAYGVFKATDNGTAGLGQQKSFAETTQVYVGKSEGMVQNFTLEFDPTSFSMTMGGNTVTEAYGNHFDYLTYVRNGYKGTPTVPTDFTNGAYAFAGTWFDKKGGAPIINATFSTVPEPLTALCVLGSLSGLGAYLRKRK